MDIDKLKPESFVSDHDQLNNWAKKAQVSLIEYLNSSDKKLKEKLKNKAIIHVDIYYHMKKIIDKLISKKKEIDALKRSHEIKLKQLENEEKIFTKICVDEHERQLQLEKNRG